jgi:hypothetical protein
VDEKAENFQLREDAPILQRLPQFERIPFDKIGLYADAFRKEETIKK